MGSGGDEFSNRIPIALAALIALVFIATLAGIAGWLAIALRAPAPEPVRTYSVEACRICGVVEEVRELEQAGAGAQPLNGDQSESIVILIAALGGGAPRLVALPRTYETAVRFEDGSVRLLRDGRAPHWKRGDRVKVLKGRVEPISRDG
jgi:hypothetical protein